MRNLYSVLVLALVLLVACGNKAEPESSTGAAVTADLMRLVAIRKDTRGLTDPITFRGVLNITNGYSSPITLERVEFAGTVGPHPVDSAIQQLNMTVPAGASLELKLDGRLAWKDNAPINAQQGTLSGTLYYRGPNGGIKNLPFDLGGDLTVRAN